jgi:regulator of protease activity HflC (stomatin/prohibitin superfamily)
MEIIAQLQIYLGILIIVLLILSQAVKILREYERGVIFRLGRLVGAKGPGLILLIPIVDRIVRMSLRIITMDVPAQEVAVVEVQNFTNATSQIAQTTLRSVLGQMELDEILSQREKINQTLQKIVDEHTGPWGIKVTAVETKDIELPEGMKRAMAKQAEAERERRAKVIHAEGEYQASEKLVKAADRIAKEPIALQLRYLQTLTEVATEKNSTTLFPIPIDLIKPFLENYGSKESKKK